MVFTGSYKKLSLRAVRDRWVWLVLGVILFILSLIVSWNASAGEPPREVVVAATDEALVDMIKTSGPAGGLVLVLGWFIRTWQADNKTQNAETKSLIAELSKRIDNAHSTDSVLNIAIVTLQGALQTTRVEHTGAIERMRAEHTGAIANLLERTRAEHAVLIDRITKVEKKTTGLHVRARDDE